ncbi:hypothetical protein PT974_09627 [Cladobotryum mycophilum]|uniref:Uncharacterized protein n=1 Tax=Cladobotryum mycophilum TaxID=491253 RepID=A0ABR0SGS7_9HYPO
MTFPSSFHMPGAWNSDGVHPGLFRPPVSPSPSADYIPSPAFTADTNSKRKWNRRDVPRLQDVAPSDGFLDGEGFLAMDDNGVLGESMFSDSDYRRALGSKRSREQMNASPTGPMQLFNLPEKPAQVEGWGSLAFSTIGGVVGRVWEFCRIGGFRGFAAGGGTTFKMIPHGSMSETAPLPTPPADATFYFQANLHNDDYDDGQQQYMTPHAERFYHERPETPVSSGYSTPSGRATKRRHTDYLHELGRNWVMIREPSEAGERRTPRKASSSHRSSSQPRSQASPATGGSRRFATPNPRHSAPVLTSAPRRPASRTTSRPASRLSDTSSVRPARPASAASFASFTGRHSPSPSKIPVRVPTVVASTATTASPSVVAAAAAVTPTHSNSRRRRNSAVPAPSQPPPHRGHRRTNSAASLVPASLASNRGNGIEDSPRLDAEAKHLATRRKIEERETDFRMAAFNKRLQDMIRQGKEALGTTIEVDVREEAEEEEGGWEDEN